MAGRRRRQATGGIHAAAQGPQGHAAWLARSLCARASGFADGWPVAYNAKAGWADLTHCYGSVGVGRDLAPDTGTGGELYAVIGHAPRQLDRDIAIVGRVVEGIDRFSTLPRGTEALGFYKDKAQYVPIASIRLASEIPANRPPGL